MFIWGIGEPKHLSHPRPRCTTSPALSRSASNRLSSAISLEYLAYNHNNALLNDDGGRSGSLAKPANQSATKEFVSRSPATSP